MSSVSPTLHRVSVSLTTRGRRRTRLTPFSSLHVTCLQYITGTMRKNNVPAALKQLQVDESNRMAWRYSPEFKCWGYKIFDKSEFYMLSTFVPPSDAISYRRTAGVDGRVELNMGKVTVEYEYPCAFADITNCRAGYDLCGCVCGPLHHNEGERWTPSAPWTTSIVVN